MANLPEEVIVPERLRENASKDIGKSPVFLEGPAENQLTLRDIWTRLLRDLDGLDGFNQAILALDGCTPTAIIFSGLPNACAVFKLMNEYSISAAGSIGFIRHIKLAVGETLSWHLSPEEHATNTSHMRIWCNRPKPRKPGPIALSKDEAALVERFRSAALPRPPEVRPRRGH